MRISLATRHADERFTPLALLYLKAALVEHAGIPANDIIILEFPPESSAAEMAAAIARSAPDVLALSCYVWNVIDLMDAARLVVAHHPAAHVVAGGPEVGPIGRQVLERYPFLEVVVKSEGERPLVDLVLGWHSPGARPVVTGIWTRVDGEIRERPDAEIVADLGELASPQMRDDVDYDGRIVCVETQRGCVFRCSFCFYNKDLSIRNRRFDLDRVKAELAFWLDRDITQLYLMDPVFNLNAARAKEICRFLAEHNHRRIPIHAEIWAEFVDDELAALMKAAHFDFLEVGLQTTDVATLATVDRRLKLQPFLDGIAHLRAHDLACEVQLILGLPGDSLASFKDSLNFAAALAPSYLAAFTLMVLPGTELWRQAVSLRLEYQPQPPYFIKSTPHISADQLVHGRRMALAVRGLWNSRTVRLLCREPGTTFADLVEDWAVWIDDRGLVDDAPVAEHLAAFIDSFCARHGIAPQFYRGAVTIELS